MADINSDIVELQKTPHNLWLIVNEYHLQIKITHNTNKAKFNRQINNTSRASARRRLAKAPKRAPSTMGPFLIGLRPSSGLVVKYDNNTKIQSPATAFAGAINC